jgi:hypothetical protein
MRGKCCLKKGENGSSPSLRRHYPDQVYGYYLSLHAFGGKHPGNAETYKFIL